MDYQKEAKKWKLKAELAEAENAEMRQRIGVLEAEVKSLQFSYLAMGPHCWVRGDTYEQAVERCKSHWPGSMFPTGEIRVIKGRNLKIDAMGRVTGQDAEEVATIPINYYEDTPQGREDLADPEDDDEGGQ